jgi:hypothetical protein
MEMMVLTPNKLEHELEFRRRFSYWGDVDISGSLIFADGTCCCIQSKLATIIRYL